MTSIVLDDISIAVEFKRVKHLHLKVRPPDGQVRITAPEHLSVDTLRLFAIEKLGWIRRKQKELRDQPREYPRVYQNRESHYLWGHRYLLVIEETDDRPEIIPGHSEMVMRIAPHTDTAGRKRLMERFYRQELRRAIPPYIEKWSKRLGVTVAGFFVQRMKTRWASCRPGRATLRFNTELARNPPDCLDYIVLHEMVHLIEPTHNARFLALMDHHLPLWRHRQTDLDRSLLSHVDWNSNTTL